MKLSLNKYYILFSLIGWILLFLFTLALRKIIGVEVSPDRFKYLITESVTCGVLAYSTTFIVSIFIDLSVNFNNIRRIDIYKVLVLFILAQLLYSILIWPLLDMIDFWGASLGSIKKATFLVRSFNAIYFATLYFIWLFVFITIKMYYHVNVVKMKQFQLESSLKESQLNTLKGRINPHFMFDSVNNIRGLMLEDVNKARQILTSLSETLRYSLTKNSLDSITLEDELDVVDKYVEISKIQFEDRLQFQKEVDPHTLSIEIPPMLVQMLVENAIKHGVSNLKEGGVLRLSTGIIDNILKIEVSNPGQLKEVKNTTKLGLKNIEKRLRLLYGNKAKFTLESFEDKVKAIVKIPLEA